jgi:hypothetical protein
MVVRVQQHGPIPCDGIDRAIRRGRPAIVVPTVADHDAVARMSAQMRADTIERGSGAAAPSQIQLGERVRPAEQMDMGIADARSHRVAAGVDPARRAAGQRFQFGRSAQGDDPPVADTD